MTAFLIYLAKAGAGMAAFHLFYFLFFRQSKQFRFLRVYLLSSILASFVIPLISITLPKPASSGNGFELPMTGHVETAGVTATDTFTTEQIIFFVFCIGFVLFLCKFLIGNIKALSLIRKSRTGQVHGIKCNISEDDVHPFSFFNRIVIPVRILQSPHLQVILNHEQIHVNEQHTIDVFIAEILFLFQWFNPFAWLMKDAVKNNIEFLTDDQIIRRTDRQHYQMAMVAMADKEGIAPFLTALNGSQLKSRIIMMKKKTETKRQLLRKLLILPILTVLVLTLSNKQFEAAPLPSGPNPLSSILTNDSAIHVRIDDLGIRKDSTFHPVYLVDGKEVESIEDIAPKDIESIDVLKDAAAVELMGERGKNGVISIKMKKNDDTTSHEKSSKIRTTPDNIVKIRTTGPDKKGHPLIILDGKNKGNVDIETLELNPEDVESIDVLKEDKLTEPYGDEGKDGVILIKTKKSK